MLLDMLQGVPMMHPGTSDAQLPSSPVDGLSPTYILSSCSLPDDACSAASLLHILQEGVCAKSSTTVMVDSGKMLAQNQQLCRLNSSSRQEYTSQAVRLRSEDGAQQSTQTSLDEESSLQISTGENNAASACIGDDAQPAVINASKIRITESCSLDNPACGAPETMAPRPAKRQKRTRTCKNSEEVESQRRTHIAVERNRRKQMNEHLTVLRSLMPATYIQRGDQASIIGGAIDFVKELEHVLQALQMRKQCRGCEFTRSLSTNHDSAIILESLMLKPHFVQRSSKFSYEEVPRDIFAHLTCQGVDVEVNLIGSRALVRVLAPKLPHQLLKVASSFEILHLKILHLNITTIEQSVLYAFNLEMQSESRTLVANDIAQSLQNIFKL